MPKKTQLGDIMETSCPHCNAHFRVSDNQLQSALGRVKCGQCNQVFNALQSLKSFEGKLPKNFHQDTAIKANENEEYFPGTSNAQQSEHSELSLHEAMYGHERNSLANFAPFLWFVGIVILVILGIAQTIYYHRYQLIDKPKYQQQVISLCQLLPCAESDFSSIRQIKLLERNVFTHPVSSDALMITGSFVNQAPFAQKLPSMLVSLFDIQGNLIANRIFEPDEYLQNDQVKTSMDSGKPVQFRLEVVDPGTAALTYEFEFF